MKIKNVSCTQFAGARDRSVSFEDGINIILGKNESGKSTLVNLLSRTLFQNAKIDKRSDKEFKNLYFPAYLRNGGEQGDYADGEVTFESGGVTYTVSKEWGDDPKYMLETPAGKIKDKKRIAEILRGALQYGEGVYEDILFTSQRGSDAALKTLMDSTETTDTKQEIADAASRAFAESDGVSIEAVGEAIDRKIKELEGAHWDYEKCMPAKKTGSGRWGTGLGVVLKAYYELEDAKNLLQDIENLETEADSAANEYTIKDNEFKEREKAYDDFSVFAGQLVVQKELKEKIGIRATELRSLSDTLTKWPEQEKQLGDAQRLGRELEQRKIIDKYELAKGVKERLESIERQLENMPSPTSDEVKTVKKNVRQISLLENKLCGMNLAAKIKMLSNHEVYVKTVRTGEIIDITDCAAAITEAVRIEIPGVMELTLSPADVDVQYINDEMAELNKQMQKVYEKYDADSAERLEDMASEYAEKILQKEKMQDRLNQILNGVDFDLLEETAEKASARNAEEIRAELMALCQTEDAQQCITKNKTLIDKNIEEYGSFEELEKRLKVVGESLEKAKISLSSVVDIPEKFEKIADPQAHLKELKDKLDQIREKRDDALKYKTDAQSRLQTRMEDTEGEPSEKVKAAKERFEQLNELLGNWKEIQRVYNRKKSELQDNPMHDIGEKFTGYLELITSGNVSSELTEQNKVSMSIYSGNRLVDYSKLSEGTKETVALAFRLAVLEHLFPEGGGVAVLDDPFTDMDEDRMRQSCRLVQEFAKRNQVIFLTCRQEYADALEGNLITL